MSLSLGQIVIAVVVVVCATAVAAITGLIGADALVGVYLSVLGYVFGFSHGRVSARTQV